MQLLLAVGPVPAGHAMVPPETACPSGSGEAGAAGGGAGDGIGVGIDAGVGVVGVPPHDAAAIMAIRRPTPPIARVVVTAVGIMLDGRLEPHRQSRQERRRHAPGSTPYAKKGRIHKDPASTSHLL